VNVYVGTNASNFKVPYNRSVVADDEDKLLSSSPTIYKLY
jgi:hypothetical protein